MSGSRIQLYAAGVGGTGSAAVPLLSTPVQSDNDGNFLIPAGYHCPSASSQIYVVASGGNPGLSSGTDNPALALTAVLGSCGSLSTTSPVLIDEVTTVGSVWPLASYMKSPVSLGSAANDTAFSGAVSSVPVFVNLTQGTSPGIATHNSFFAQSSKLYSLADVLSNCVNSSGGSAGDGSACGALFSSATPAGGTPPTDTISAAVQIAQNPTHNVNGIFGLIRTGTAFQPTLTAAPRDWSLALTYSVATPSISLATGTYVGAQEVTLGDSTPGSTIYYTTDGTAPTSSSLAYTGPISIAVSSTVQAMAILQGSQSSTASSTLTITTALTPARLVFLQQPSNTLTQAPISPAVTVVVEDSDGKPVLTAADPVTIALAGGAGLGGTLTVSPQNGIATFSNLNISTAGSGYTLLATSPNISPAISAVFAVSAPGSSAPTQPVKLAFLQQPTNAATGATIAPAVQVAVEDGNGNTVVAATNPITLALAGGTGLGGTLTVTPQNGIATFSNLSVSTAGTYTLSAASANLASATSASFTISAAINNPLPPAKLAFLLQPSNAVTGATISPAVQVVVEDASGNTVTAATNPVTLALAGGTGLAGTLTVTPQNGIATFSDLTISNAGTGYTLSATSPNLTAAVSASFTVTAPSSGDSPVKLAFVQQPTNALTGAPISPAVTVVVEDANGNTVGDSTNPITLSLAAGTGLGGTLTATPQNGIATFSNLTVSTAGIGDKLSAVSPNLTSATSASFTISAPVNNPPPAKLAFQQQPSSAMVGATISPAVQVVVEDSSGNVVTTATNPVTIVLSGGSGLGGTLTVTPQNGIATFSSLSVSTAGNGLTLTANSPDLTSATSASFNISASGSAPSASKLAFQQQPSNASVGATITPAVQVVVEDSSGNVVTTATTAVTIALTGASGLGGTLTVTAQNGVATFSNLSVSAAGSYTLSATGSGLTSATSASFTISAASAPSASKLAFQRQPSNASAGATITPAVQVVVEDSSGNVVTTATNAVTLALTGASGLGGTLTVTTQNGVATFSNLSVSAAGTYTLTATSSGLTSATSNGFTISASSSTPSNTYYLSPTGSDSNSGTSSSSPWLTPNHALSCGDTILAASGTYSNSNFSWNSWGTVSCPAANNVAWLKCATFDTCKIDATNGSQGIWVAKSYWGVQGWEVTTSSTAQYGTCFFAEPFGGSPAEITHIVFANNVANGCSNYGYASNYYNASASPDHVAFIGNIAYNTAQGGIAGCASGFSILEPIPADTAAGTHIYLAGNFSWSNRDADPCDGTAPTDGEGIILDGLAVHSYNQQVAILNNITIFNGSEGILNGGVGGNTLAKVYIDHNTAYSNNEDPNQDGYDVGEISITAGSSHSASKYSEASYNLAVRPATTPPGATANAYALSVVYADSTTSVDNNWAYGPGGHNSVIYSSGSFAYGSGNVFGTDPVLRNPVLPGAPNCSGYANTAACMATVIANFTPTASGSSGYGYQIPSGTPNSDPLFPQWLCNVNLPSGLVTTGCSSASNQSDVSTGGNKRQ